MGKGESRRKISNRNSGLLTDVTLNDCANNPRKARIGKAKIGLEVVGNEIDAEPDMDDAPCLDCGKDLFPSKKQSYLKWKENELRVTYPSDVWFLIARYIAPEDLLNFALICKDSYRVLLSTKFWKELCKRILSENSPIPRSLQNPCDSRLGLRSRAIRLLFLCCPTLMQRIKPPVASRYEPYTLQGMRLVLAWHEKEGNNWNYWFKWTRRRTDHEVPPKHQRSELFENPELDCRILKATCSEFIGFQYPYNSYLASISLSLTSDMRGQKLSLGFNDYITTHCSARTKQTLGRAGLVQQRVDLEPVTHCVLMDWWHPEYPHANEGSGFSITPCTDEEW